MQNISETKHFGFRVQYETQNGFRIEHETHFVRLASTPMNITIIQCYAPTSQYDDDMIEEFYDDVAIPVSYTHLTLPTNREV